MYTKKLGSNLTPEHLGRLLQETCVAEIVHDALIILSPFVLFFAEGATAVVCMTLFMVGNVPFVMIQRYNRPKLARLYRVALAKKAETEAVDVEGEQIDTVC